MKLCSGIYLDFLVFDEYYKNLKVVDFCENKDGTYYVVTDKFHSLFIRDYSSKFTKYISLDRSIWFYN